MALALLLKAKYPFLKDDVFPGGRLLPYVMFGPAAVWTTSLTNTTFEQTSTDVGFVAETGLQYFFVQNFAAGVGFRYRHTWGPGYDFRRAVNFVDLSTNTDQYSVLMRVSYHF
jgi:opacity protein-like surface antigen